MGKLLNIPLVNLQLQHRSLKREFDKILRNVFKSSSFIKGPILERFEKDFANFLEVKYCIGVASGTDALHLSLVALGIGKGDEVIIPVNTFIATAYAILYTGAKPVFVDIDSKTYNIDTELIENKINKKTKAIIPVHLYGQPANMDKILYLAKKYKLFIIEDACQSHGATYKGKYTGTFGDLAAFSFYPSKNLGACGDAGAVTTNSLKFYKILNKIREYGFIDKKYIYDKIGYNSRLDAMQAAILGIKLKYLRQWNTKRERLANYYNIKIKHIPHITIPFIDKSVVSVYHLYVIRTIKRNLLIKHLSSKGIQTGIHYPIPLHLQKSLSCLGYKNGDFPIAETICKEILSIPLYPELTTTGQDYIIKSIREFAKYKYDY